MDKLNHYRQDEETGLHRTMIDVKIEPTQICDCGMGMP